MIDRTGGSLPRGVRAAAARAARRARSLLGGRGAVDVTIVGDAEIRRLNRRWFRRRRATDVIAFPFGEDGFLGDVVLSLDAARRQAREIGHPVPREVGILAAHGTLHLLGERDGTAQGRRRMDRLAAAAAG